MKWKCCQFWDHKQEKYELVTFNSWERNKLMVCATLLTVCHSLSDCLAFSHQHFIKNVRRWKSLDVIYKLCFVSCLHYLSRIFYMEIKMFNHVKCTLMLKSSVTQKKKYCCYVLVESVTTILTKIKIHVLNAFFLFPFFPCTFQKVWFLRTL